jgi:hypothetical protein
MPLLTPLPHVPISSERMVHSRMSCRIPWLVFASVGMLLMGCGGKNIATHAVEAPSSHPPPVSSVAAAAHQITLLSRKWEQAFTTSRWQEIRDSFVSGHDAAALVGQMTRWREGRVRLLHIVPTYVQRVSKDNYVGTLRFTDDPRAVPAFQIYIFNLLGMQTRVLGTTTGIQGSNFTNVRWSVTRSKHFVVFHSPYEVQGSDRQYLADLEHQRIQVERKFGVLLPPLASYYLYPQTSLMARLTTRTCGAHPDNVGCTNPYTRPPSIQTSVWPTYHEPIHVYELALEPGVVRTTFLVAPLFIAEGTAVALEDREADPRLSDYCSILVYVPLDVCAQVGIGLTRPLDLLSDRGFKRAEAGNAYALSGSFVKYLILKYGYRPFAKFYYKLAAQPSDSVKDYNVATYSIYHASVTQLLQAWRHEVCAHGCA